MHWYKTKDKLPAHMTSCVCVLTKKKGIVHAFYDGELGLFISNGSYGRSYSVDTILAWASDLDITEDCRRSIK